MTVDARYSARFESPTLIERGRSNTLQCRVYRAGALVAPSAGTITIYDDSDTAVVSAAAVTITSSIAEYAYNPASTLTLADSWRVEWALTMPDGNVHKFRNEAALVRCVPANNITEADLYRRVSALDPSGSAPIHSATDFADKIDEAETMITLRLYEAGKRIYLMVSPSELREVRVLLTLALIFEDFSVRLNAAYAEAAANYRNQYEAAWGRLRLTYDTDDDGDPEVGKVAPSAILFLTSRK